MTAFGFFVCCCGIAVVTVASALAYYIVRAVNSYEAVEDDDRGDPVSEGLANRLQELQEARFASPIVKRQLGVDVRQPPAPIGRVVKRSLRQGPPPLPHRNDAPAGKKEG